MTMEREISMRAIQWLGLSLTAVFLLLCGGGGGSSGGDSTQPPSGLNYTTGTAVYAVRVPITVNSPASTGGAVTS